MDVNGQKYWPKMLTAHSVTPKNLFRPKKFRKNNVKTVFTTNVFRKNVFSKTGGIYIT